jgi:hypothetical protein
VPAYKRIQALQQKLLKENGINPGRQVEMITDALQRIAFPKSVPTKGKYATLLDFLFKAEAGKDAGSDEIADLWSQCSAIFAKNSTVVAVLSGRDLKLSSGFCDIELAVLHYRRDLKPEMREKVAKLPKGKKKVDAELERIDAEPFSLLKQSEARLKRYKLTLNHSRAWN